ncbi:MULTISPECIES: sulfur transferase domain-containing protein, partial [Hyphomicrobiales]|uniref:beta-lactamase hydrolase domain-containing protein n=1 Tax=Methylobacterium sp. CCH7-A2 TaxID=1768789 RepID=UPI001FD91576
MTSIDLSPKLTAAGQPDATVIGGLAGSRFAGIVNVRPDGEEGGQIDHEKAAAIAREAGLGYAYVPLTSAAITEADIRAFQRAVAETKGPVYAHCRSGTRVAILHVL